MLALFRTAFAPPRHLILLLAAAWVGQWLAERRAGGLRNAIEKLATGMLIAFLVGGRLFFIVSHAASFVQSPISLISLNTALFDAWGGALCASIAAAIVMQRLRLRVWQTLDLLTPLLAALAIGTSLSHLASGEAFGSETSVPWAITLWGAQRHPTQVYEMLAGVVALALVWRRAADADEGSTFLLWVALTAGGRLIIEAFRGDSVLVLGGYCLAQILAWMTLAAALSGLEYLKDRRRTRTQPPNAERASSS